MALYEHGGEAPVVGSDAPSIGLMRASVPDAPREPSTQKTLRRADRASLIPSSCVRDGHPGGVRSPRPGEASPSRVSMDRRPHAVGASPG